MQAMLERDRRYKLGAAGPRIEIDDAYIGGERTGEGSGRGRRGHTPFIVAIETSDDGRPLYARLQVVRGSGPVELSALSTMLLLPGPGRITPFRNFDDAQKNIATITDRHFRLCPPVPTFHQGTP